MNINLGNLKIFPAVDHPEWVAKRVFENVKIHLNANLIGACEIDPELSDTAAFCEHYKVALNQSANCVVLEAKRAERTWFAACVVLANTRADVNGLIRRTLDARRVSFAPMDRAVSETEMEYGAITPIGLPEDWSILVDEAVANSEYVVIGSGMRKSKLIVPGSFFSALPNVQIIEGLGQEKL